MVRDDGVHYPPALPANRREESERLRSLAAAVCAGDSRVLVVSGEAGVGKTALLGYLGDVAAASGALVIRTVAVQSEMELAFAGLHQVCSPILDGLAAVAAPQREALRTAFGLVEGPSPDRFLVGLAVLSLLSAAASDRPLICIVDDQQWLDRESAQVLGFVARRLEADPVGLVFGIREPGTELAGLPELRVGGLSETDSRALLRSLLPGPLDERVRDQIAAEARGNPLALSELHRGLTPARLAGGFGLPGVTSLSSRIEASYRSRLEPLSPDARRFLLLAAADPSGDLGLVRRAAAAVGIPVDAAIASVLRADVVDIADRLRFRHPLLRSAVYRSAAADVRRATHLTLAEATDPTADPDRRAWHRAEAAAGPDEDVATELERSAARAMARGGLAAAAAFLRRSVLLSVDPVRRNERTLAAAETNLLSGALDAATEMLATAESADLSEAQTARVDLLRGRIAFAAGRADQSPRLLLTAATRLEQVDPVLARETYLMAWMAALFAGSHTEEPTLLDVSRAALRSAPPQERTEPADLLLNALARLATEEPAVAAPSLRAAAASVLSADTPVAEQIRLGWFAQAAMSAVWDFGSWRSVLESQVRAGREAGALNQLPVMLAALGVAVAWSGDFAAASILSTELDNVCTVTGTRQTSFIPVFLTGLVGDKQQALPLIANAIAEARANRQGIAETFAHWAAAILHNGLGQYDEALAAARAATDDAPNPYISTWAFAELVEAAVRAGRTPEALATLERLARSTQAGGTDEALGIEARCRALVSPDDEAEPLYRQAIDCLERTSLRPDYARARLLYGEWLRRGSRRTQARAELRAAHDLFTELGLRAFAERARRELAASGGKARVRGVEPSGSVLTAQEALIASLARDGSSNAEIGAQLFLSVRTVEWHLRKIFVKLGVGSRRELAEALSGSAAMSGDLPVAADGD